MNQYPSPSPVPSPGEPIDTPVDPISTFTIKPVKPFSTPSGIAPINNVQYGGHSSVNDSLTPNDDYVWEVNTEKWRKWEDSWQDNAETAGEQPNLSQTEKEVHFTGLVAYVTADLSPESAEASRKIIGKTSTPYTGDSYSNLIVGRALCSLAGYTGNPVGFIRERGETALGLAMPTQGYSTENQLYTLIGSTFAKNERDALTKRQQEQQSRIQAAQKQREEVLPGALTAIATSNAVTPLQRKVLDESGISGLTITRIRQLTQQSGVVTTQENATPASDDSLKSVRLLGLEHND